MTEVEALKLGQLRRDERVCVLGTPEGCPVSVPRNHEGRVVARSSDGGERVRKLSGDNCAAGGGACPSSQSRPGEPLTSSDQERREVRGTTWYTVELVGLDHEGSGEICLPEHLLHSVLPTTYMFHAPPTEYDDDCLRVRGAKGAGVFCNGEYGCMPVRFHLNYPVYKNASGAEEAKKRPN